MVTNIVRKVSSMISLPAEKYPGLSQAVSAFVNYGIDSYFAKLDSRYVKSEPGPVSPSTHIQELWLGCEAHKFIKLGVSYPGFTQPLNAHAFAMLFEPYGGDLAPYKIIPFLDTYQYKEMLKCDYRWQMQFKSIRISPTKSVSLPTFGHFFVVSKTGEKLIIKIDLCHESIGCEFTIISNNQKTAEDFLNELESSRNINNIYHAQCLTYDCGVLDFNDVTPTSWSQIIMKPQLKDDILENTVGILKNINILKNIGMTPSRNLMLISPPGMAKTTIFRAITRDMVGTVTSIWCTGKSIQFPEHVTALFEAARYLAPSIIFIEDMDLFGRNRSIGSENRVLNEFLACLDGASENSGIVVMASTNDIASMDEALVNRPGRFDVKIDIPLPDEDDRKKMIACFLSHFHAVPDSSVTQDTLKAVLDQTQGLTGAYIKDLIKTAVLRAVTFGKVKDGIVSLNSEDLLVASERILKNFKLGQMAQKHHTHQP